MRLEVLDSADAVAKAAAGLVAAEARAAIAARGKFVFAVSGGTTPWVMLRELAKEDLHWSAVHVCQVDERIAPAGDPDRNLTHLQASLLAHAPIPPENIHAMPVEADPPAPGEYETTLKELCGIPPVFDLIHLGMGPDGHTASLVPGDASLDVKDADVAITGVYQNRRRMTLTYPVIDRARSILWLVTGENKREMLTRLRKADAGIPAGRVSQASATILADKAAVGI